MNDLENLRKRAKQVVRQHRNREHVVADRIRRTLPQFAGLDDRAVLDAQFALHDAQELIARELGFVSWAELKETTPMSAPTATPGNEPQFQRAQACVFVTDFARAIAFYRDQLGFEITYTYGEPPFWGEVRRDNIAFNLRHVDQSPFVANVRDAEQLLSVSVTTTEVKALFLEYQAAGVDFQERLKEAPWKWVAFVVRDPDGNLILFGSPS